MNPVNSTQTDASVEIDYGELDHIVDEEFSNDKENLIMILQAIQRRYNYLPEPALVHVSQRMGVPVSEIYGVGTFYKTFSIEPRGRNIISVCRGTACHVRGSSSMSERLQKTLNIREGETTTDGRFTLEVVRCVGCCSHGPVIKINEDIYSGIRPDEIQKILEKYE
ncbi:MAG: NADH-quinone oxidoreductase subunit NuoE [Deltaproteobacteria bacterium]|nr:NADH-quinone oxidoreductase subunit NuoE [Deltaproteobacteria bacterium]